jgi:hypothetical protein
MWKLTASSTFEMLPTVTVDVAAFTPSTHPVLKKNQTSTKKKSRSTQQQQLEEEEEEEEAIQK